MNRSIIIALIIAIVSVSFVGCNSEKIDMTKISKNDLKKFEFRESDKYDCMEIVYGNIVYRPFCAAEPVDVDRDKLIGYYSDEQGSDEYVFALKNNAEKSWLVDVDLGEDGNVSGETVHMIWKSVDEKDIPKDLKVDPEYKIWN